MYGYHNHNHFCDGQGAPEEYLRQAKALGFQQFGFSSHGPLPFEADWTLNPAEIPAYQAELSRLSKEWARKAPGLRLLRGLELDYLGGEALDWTRRWRNELALDYCILSVHILPGEGSHRGKIEHLSVDNTPKEWEQLVNSGYGGSVERTVKDFYRHQAEAAETGLGDILGHFDLVKKLNRRSRYFHEDEPWYRRAVAESLERIAATPMIMEINTGGMSRGKTTEPYPAPWIIDEAHRRGIPFTLTADAHRPEHIGYAFSEMVDLLADHGIRELIRWEEGRWVLGPARDFL